MTMGSKRTLAGTATIGLALLLSGCASRVDRVQAALVKAGVAEKMAACLAPRLVDRLSDDQLRALAAAAKRPAENGGHGGAADVIARVAGTGDPQIIEVVSRAGLHCALRA